MPDDFNLLAMVEGRRSEDLATEVLAYLLRHAQFRAEQQRFYEELLRDGKNEGTVERAFEVTTQVWRDSERPDLRIVGPDIYVLVENKFTAGYTDQQLARYARRLHDENARTKVLVLLCPEIWRHAYVKLAAIQFGVSSGSEKDVCKKLCDESNIDFHVMTWDRLLVLFGEQHLLTAELSRFVESRYLHVVELTNDDVVRLMTREIPDLLETIFLYVDNLNSALGRFPLTLSSSRSGSARWYGFSMELDGWKFWLGYSLLQWKRSIAPIVLQVLSSPSGTQLVHFEQTLRGCGFTPGQDEYGRTSWYCAVPIRANDKGLPAQIATEVYDKCNLLATAIADASDATA
jgi:hypothetical protein